MEKFDLEKAKAGAKVCTRNGKKARIICVDRDDDTSHIVALVQNKGYESIVCYDNQGMFLPYEERGEDLMMVREKHYGWVVLYRDRDTGRLCTDMCRSRQVASLRAHYHGDTTLAVRKIEWEE